MIMPTKSAEELGIPYALHSDYPISRYEPMIRISGAVNRMTKDAVLIGANQRIDAEEAIRAYTVGGAYTSFEENQKGRIMIGQYADLVVLDHDPVTTKAVEIDKIKVLMTIVGGRIVYDTHELGKKELAVHGNPFISKSGF
jgi:predicted amidohydrolase YtcJ